MTLEAAYDLLWTGALIVIGVFLALAVIKSVIGPKISDRLMTVGTVGTLVTGAISVLSVLLSGESYLIDICLIYVLISFLSVVVFTEVYVNEYIDRAKKADRRDDGAEKKEDTK